MVEFDLLNWCMFNVLIDFWKFCLLFYFIGKGLFGYVDFVDLERLVCNLFFLSMVEFHGLVM